MNEEKIKKYQELVVYAKNHGMGLRKAAEKKGLKPATVYGWSARYGKKPQIITYSGRQERKIMKPRIVSMRAVVLDGSPEQIAEFLRISK